MGKCNRPEDFAARLAKAERGILEEEGEDGDGDADPRAAARARMGGGPKH